MRVRAIRNKFENCPPLIATAGSPETITHIVIGNEYEVHAICVFKGVVHLQIVKDDDFISWDPAWFFEIIDTAIPGDWICNLFDDVLQMVIGPDFIAADEASYIRMAEEEWDSVGKFWGRLRARPSDEE